MAWQCTAVAAALWQYGGDADNNKKAHSPWGWRAKKAIGHGRNPIVFLRKKTDNNDYKKQQQQQKGPWGLGRSRARTKRRKEGPLLKKKLWAAVLVVRARACATKAYADKKKNKKKGQKAACMGGRLAGEAGAHRPFFSLSPAPARAAAIEKGRVSWQRGKRAPGHAPAADDDGNCTHKEDNKTFFVS